MTRLLEAVKLAYRKHHLGDESIGWNELSDILQNALCNEMGDKGFQDWLTLQSAVALDARQRCNHDWICFAGHPAVECRKCKRLRK